MKKETSFKIIAMLLPILLVILLELILRLFNLFPQIPLFIEDKKQNLVTVNSQIGERYFDKRKVPVPNLYPQTFSYEKSSDTYRIFCLGGSTTAGFPYEMTVPFPQQLKFMLTEKHPEKNFEVINIGLSAINSFTVLDWLPEILEHDPDLVLIYMGHNEFYGAYGTGSNISVGNNGTFSRFMLNMQKVRIFQAVKSLVNSLTPQQPVVTDATLMEKITDNRNIPPDSELRQITYQNYADNLDIILKKLGKKKIPVIMSNLVSNLKDQPPLGQNSESFRKSKTLDEFILAKDLDEIPFRAPSSINTIIAKKTNEHDVIFVDMFQKFNDKTLGGIPGNNLFCDHLHPNPVGYYLMATQFLNRIFEADILSGNASENAELTPKFVTQLDWEIGGLRVFKLEQKWPFYSQETQYPGRIKPTRKPVVEIAEDFLFDHHIWGKAHSDMAEYYENENAYDLACKEYQAILAMFPEKLDYYLKLMNSAQKARDWKLLEQTGQKALALTSVQGMLYYNIALAQRNQGKLRRAFDNVQKALNSGDLTHEQLGYVFYLKALILTDIKEYAEARKILEVIIEEAPDFDAAKKLLKEINNKQK